MSDHKKSKLEEDGLFEYQFSLSCSIEAFILICVLIIVFILCLIAYF